MGSTAIPTKEVVDWANVERGTPVYARHSGKVAWTKRYFVAYVEGIERPFLLARSTHSLANPSGYNICVLEEPKQYKSSEVA